MHIHTDNLSLFFFPEHNLEAGYYESIPPELASGITSDEPDYALCGDGKARQVSQYFVPISVATEELPNQIGI